MQLNCKFLEQGWTRLLILFFSFLFLRFQDCFFPEVSPVQRITSIGSIIWRLIYAYFVMQRRRNWNVTKEYTWKPTYDSTLHLSATYQSTKILHQSCGSSYAFQPTSLTSFSSLLIEITSTRIFLGIFIYMIYIQDTKHRFKTRNHIGFREL